MPIDLEQFQKATQEGRSYDVLTSVKNFSPKFFSSKLTGSGKKNGILCADNNPCNRLNMPVKTTQEHLYTKKHSYANGQTSVVSVPFFVLGVDAWRDAMSMLRVPDKAELSCVASRTVASKTVNAYVRMTPHSLIVEEKTDTHTTNGVTITNKSPRKLAICYQLIMYREADPQDERFAKCYDATSAFQPPAGNDVGVSATGSSFGSMQNGYFTEFTCNPLTHFNQFMSLLNGLGYIIDAQAQADFTQNYDLYAAVCKCSELWQTGVHTLLDNYFENVAALTAANPNSSVLLNMTAMTLRHLENYAVPLDLYREIYHSVQTRFPADVSTIMCKQNLNLLLSDQLNSLNNNKPKLTSFHPKNPAQTPAAAAHKFSPEQLKAITSQEPLILVQAGAGTGKALDLDTPVLTPAGWTLMRDIKIGDKVIGSDGRPHIVTNVWDHAAKRAYKLTFRDGASVIACDEHLWTTLHLRRGEEIERTITTEQWVNEKRYRRYDFLPQVEPVQYAVRRKLPLDPYFMGALLADGSLHRNSIQYTKSENGVIDAVKTAAAASGYDMYETTCGTSTARQWRFHHPDDHRSKAKLRRLIHSLGLNVPAHLKFIPDIYKTASVEQRKQLLNGLFDGDGDVRPGRTYARFNTTSERLADDVLQLIWSLGLSATKQKLRHKRGDYWCVNLLDERWDPFMASHFKGRPAGSVRPCRRTLRSAEYLGTRPMRCISVDAADSLYVTKDFLVTHNSTCILGRIDYMVANGVSPEDITVLSFTNAAADHIKEKNPRVHSMTIASMIHSIYAANFPTHELSSEETIFNALDIYYQNDPFVKSFQKYVKGLFKQDNEGYTAMNNFIEAYTDQVIAVLNRIRQTSLALEIILCYQLIDKLSEPPDVQSKFLIIDEVQDNSIFEFIYAIKYVAKHQESLYMVGDCSQTLYEFRASNPKALNVLESSGVFQTYQLQTNYRSNQEILDFANVALRNIEANQYANIQLQSNSLVPVTETSFTDKVRFHYERLPKITDFENRFSSSVMATVIRPYVAQKLAAGEQVAFLSYTRRHANLFQALAQKAFPAATVISLVPDKPYNSTVFSLFIKNFWTGIQFLPTGNLVGMIQQTVIQNIDTLCPSKNKTNKMLPVVQTMLTNWATQYGASINAWQQQHLAGQMTMDDLLENIKQTMLDYEIQNNATRQRVLSAKNEAQKRQNQTVKADIVVSTIHSAKGLEFDNTIVLYKSDNSMPEDAKRMYYVALTRAMKSELVLVYDTLVTPNIKKDYDTIVEALHNAALASGKNPAAIKPVSVPRVKAPSDPRKQKPIVAYGDIFPVNTDAQSAFCPAAIRVPVPESCLTSADFNTADATSEEDAISDEELAFLANLPFKEEKAAAPADQDEQAGAVQSAQP